MASNWKEAKLKDVALINPAESLKKGQLSKKIPMDGLLPFCKKIPGYLIEKYNGGTKFRNGDTIMARITPCLENGKTAKVDILDNDEIGFGSTEYIVFRAIENETDSDYLYYLITSSQIREPAIKSMVGSSGRQRVQTDVVKDLNIMLPPLETQQKIAKVLGTIDDKIELNNSINNNLEQQAQAIFKSWFVDFEPFGGTMPNSWRNGTFDNIIDHTISGDWGKDTLTGNNTQKVYCIRGADIPEVRIGNKGKMPYRYILPKNYNVKKLTTGDLVVEISGGSPTQSTGRIAVITDHLLNRYDEGMVCTNFCKAIKPKDNYSMFIYYYWLYLYQKNVFFSYENGTTGIKNLDISGFIETEPITIPDIEILTKFNEFCNSIEKTIFLNGYENEQLAQLRDTLLPKLMSGEIDVSGVNIEEKIISTQL